MRVDPIKANLTNSQFQILIRSGHFFLLPRVLRWDFRCGQCADSDKLDPHEERTMKFFLDTANIDEIRDVASTGILDGITTNPTLISKEGNAFEDQLLKICSLVNGPVSAETVSRDAAGMVEEGRHLAKLHPNIVVKCPMTKEGLKATKTLSDDSIRVNVTLVFSAPQAIMAAKAGAYFVSPFVGRLDDIGENGMELIETIVDDLQQLRVHDRGARRIHSTSRSRRPGWTDGRGHLHDAGEGFRPASETSAHGQRRRTVP